MLKNMNSWMGLLFIKNTHWNEEWKNGSFANSLDFKYQYNFDFYACTGKLFYLPYTISMM